MSQESQPKNESGSYCKADISICAEDREQILVILTHVMQLIKQGYSVAELFAKNKAVHQFDYSIYTVDKATGKSK